MTVPIVNCGDASLEAMEKLTAAVHALPAYVQKGLEDHGFQVVLGRFLSSTDPELKEYDESPACTNPAIKRIICGEFFYGGPPRGEVPSIIADSLTHEAGHFVDLFLVGTGEYLDGYSSMRELFKAAAREDTKRLIESDYKQVRDAAVIRYGHAERMLAHFKRSFIDYADRDCEIYAEIFANIQGTGASMDYQIQPFFPLCAAIVQADINRLDSSTTQERTSMTFRRLKSHRVRKCSIGSP